MGALAIGSAGKGYFKFQDTANIGAALMQTTGTFIFGAIPIGKASAGVKAGVQERVGDYVVLVFMEAPFSAAQGLVEGKSVADAATQGLIEIVADPVSGALMKSKPVKKLLGKVAVPLTVKIEGKMKNIGMEFSEKVAGGQTKKYMVKGAEALLLGEGKSSKPSGVGSVSLQTDIFCRKNEAWLPVYNQAVQPLNSTAGTTLERIRGC